MKWQVFTALRSLQTFGKCCPPQLFTARQECLPHHHTGVQGNRLLTNGAEACAKCLKSVNTPASLLLWMRSEKGCSETHDA